MTEEKKEKKKAIGYIRVSAVGGRAGPGYHTRSIQRDTIDEQARRHNYEVIDVYIEENWSGADDRRPMFNEAMERIMVGEADAMIVWKVSRFSRSWSHSAAATEKLLTRKPKPADLISGEGIDTKTIAGTLLMRILFLLAAWEREVLDEQWEGIKERVVERGSHLGRTPFGYLRATDKDPDPKKPWRIQLSRARKMLEGTGFEPQPGMLIPNPDERDSVREAFHMRAREESFGAIAGMIRRTTGRRLSSNAVEAMLASRVYLGEFAYGSDDRYANKKSHPPLVSRAEFIAAQIVHHPRVRRSPVDHPLAGLVYCGSCSHRMYGNQRTAKAKMWADTGEPVGRGRRTDKSERPIIEVETTTRVYRCPGDRGKAGRCQQPQVITAEHAEAVIVERGSEVARLFVEITAAPVDHAQLAELDADIAAADEAIMELSSVSMKREMGDNWAPSLRQLREEKAILIADREALTADMGAESETRSWEQLEVEERWEHLRRGIEAVGVWPAPRGSDPASRVDVFWAGDDVPALSPATVGPLRRP